MLKKYLVLIFLGALLAVILACEKSTKEEGPKTDPEAIEALVSYYSSIFKADVFDTIKDTTFSPAFYREITKRDFYIKIDFSNAPPETIYTRIANVVLTDSIQGVFHLFLDQIEYKKSFKAVSKVSGYFEKWGEGWDDFRGWFMKKVAGNKIYSVPGISRSMELRLSSTSGDYTYSPGSVTSLTKVREVRTFESGDSLTLTIVNPITSWVYYLHYWKEGNYRKTPFISDGDTLVAGCRITGSGYQHLFIDILDRETIYDTTAEYRANAWGILFKVE